jgi:hypothetical protein
VNKKRIFRKWPSAAGDEPGVFFDNLNSGEVLAPSGIEQRVKIAFSRQKKIERDLRAKQAERVTSTVR